MELEELKDYLRIDHDEDDETLGLLQIMAHEYIKNAGGGTDNKNVLRNLAEAFLVSHWYENRELSRIGNNSYDIPHTFQGIILQLRYCYVGESS